MICNLPSHHNILPSCGIEVVDRFVEGSYSSVRGMSSRLSALAAAALLKYQNDNELGGDIAEIGTFEGRFFIALALALHGDQRAIGVDTFDWPSPQVRATLDVNLAQFDLLRSAIILEADSNTLSASAFTKGRPGFGVRFFHIDGDHEISSLVSDLELALACSAPWGVICVDDMLSPAYPELYLAVRRMLDEHQDWTVFAIVDRESLVASAKYFLCRKHMLPTYRGRLEVAFDRCVWRMGGRINGNLAVILTERPFLPQFEA